MNNYIFDNQIIIDFLTPRFDEFKDSEKLFQYLSKKSWKNIFITSSQIDNLLYVLFREKKRNGFETNAKKCYSLLSEFINLINIVKTPSYIDTENDLCSNNIEDYMIELSAKTISNAKIITRDKKFLKNSDLTISVEEFFEIENQQISKIDFLDLKAQYLSMHDEMDKAIETLVYKLASYNPEALKKWKNTLWKNTEHWDQLLIENAEISGKLVLSAFTKEALENFKNK